MSVQTKHFYAFGPFRLDSEKRVLVHDGTPVPLAPKAAEALLVLVENAGHLVDKDELMKRVWPDAFVEEVNLAKNIFFLRKILGEWDGGREYIETIPKRGYRFVAPVEEVTHAEGSAQPKTSSGQDLIGRKVSHYRVLEVIGGGGMGMVYKAEDLKLGRRVALKFLPEELANDPVALQRFEREARTASSLNHPNICTIHEVEEYEGQPFIVMELLEGQTLRDRLATATSRKKAIPLEQQVDIAIQICDGLEAAHKKGIIHRDIKPANIFLTASGQAKILDFGLAKLTVEAPGFSPAKEEEEEMTGLQPRPGLKPDSEGEPVRRAEARLFHQPATPPDATLTRTGAAMGTAGYMSPEQVRGEKLDARTDIFSFGLVLYEMATGQRAFSGETAAVVHDAILNNSPVPVRELNSTLPTKLVTTIDRALEKDRERRYQSAAEMRATLDLLRSGKRSPVRLKWKWLAVAALLIAVAVGAWVYLSSRTKIKLTDKDTIVLTHLTNSTSDPVLDDALDMPLSQELQESPYINLLNPGKVRETLRQLKVSEDAKLTADMAREICVRTNSRAFVTASISDAGNHYHIGLKALDCYSGRALAKAEVEASNRNEIVKMLGVAGHRLRRELGEPPDSLSRFNQPLEEDMSSSLEALQAFSQGIRAQGEHGNAAALPLLQRAVELDANFSLAYLNLAGVYLGVGETALSAKYARRAFDLRERLSQRSRFLTEAAYYDMATGELEKANQIYVKWLEIFPADVYPHQNLSQSLSTMGQHEKAAAEAREAVRLTPNIQTYYKLMVPFIYLNRLNEAKAVFEEAKARGIDDLSLRSNRYVVASLQGDTVGMRDQLSWAIGSPEGKEWAIQQQGDTATHHGRFRAAMGFYTRMRGYSPSSAAALADVALRDIETGNAVRAKQAAEKALAADPTSGVRKTLALVFARAGAFTQAEKLVEVIDHEFPLDSLVQKYQLPTIRATIELDKNPTRAIEILESAVPYELAVPDSFNSLYPAYVRGLAYLKLGRGRQAAAEFQKMIDHPGIVQDFVTAPLSHLQLARAQAMMGDKAAARKSYQDFLTLWKDADPDIPILKQAKAEYAKLR